MKTLGILKVIKFVLPMIMVTVWNAILLNAQDRVYTRPVFQNGWMGYGLLHGSHPSSFHESGNLKLKSENTAFVLSLGGTLIPIGVGTGFVLAATDANGIKSDGTYLTGTILIASGLYFGPSLGYFYGGRSDRAWKGIGIRFVTAMASYLVTLAIVGETIDGQEEEVAFAAVGFFGSVVLLASAITDIAYVKGAVRKRNQILRDNALTIIPTYLAEHDAPGLKVLVSF